MSLQYIIKKENEDLKLDVNTVESKTKFNEYLISKIIDLINICCAKHLIP